MPSAPPLKRPGTRLPATKTIISWGPSRRFFSVRPPVEKVNHDDSAVFAGPAGCWLACAFIRSSIAVWAAATAVVGLAFTVFGQPGWVTLTLFWLVFIPVAALLVNRSWRRQFITARALDAFAKMTPQISETEQIALDAGTVGFEGELFGGKPNWNRFIKQPLPELNAEEQAFIDGPVEQLCDMLNEWENTHY